MSDNANLTRAITDLTSALKKYLGTDGGSAGGGRSKNSGLSGLNSSATSTAGSLNDLRAELEDTADSAKHSGKSLTDLIKIIEKGSDHIGKRTAELGDAYKRQSQDMQKAGKFFSAFHDSAIFKKVNGTTHLNKTISSIQDMHHEAEVAASHLKKYGEALHKHGVEKLSSIDPKNKKALNEAFTSLRELHPKVKLYDEYKKIRAANPNLTADQARDEAKFSLLKSFDDLAGESKSLLADFSTTGGGVSRLASKFGMLTTIVVGTGEVFKALAATGREFQLSMTKGVTGSVGTFVGLQKDSLLLGTSFSDLSQGLAENYSLVARGGISGAVDLQKNNQFRLMRTEGTTEASNAAALALAQNAYLSGVNPANSAAMQNSISSQIETYRTLKAVTGESIAALAKQTQAILNSSDSIDLMVGMTKQQRLQYGQDILAEQARLHIMGMSDQAAQNMINTMNSANKSKAVDKIQASIRAQAVGGMLGIDSGLTARYAAAIRKGKGALNDDDRKAIEEWSKQVKGAQGSLAIKGMGSEIYENSIEELGGSINQNNIDSSGEATLGRDVTQKQIAARKEDQKAGAGVTTVSGWLQQIYNVLNNSIFTAIKDLSATIVVLWAGGKIAKSLGGVAGKVLGGGSIGEAIGGLGSGLAGIAGIAAGGAAALGGGAVAGYGAEKLADVAGVNKKSLWRVLGDTTAGGALAGGVAGGLAGLGVLSPVTALVGAGLGAAGGLATGLWNYFTAPDGSPAASGAASPTSKLLAPGSLSAQDVVASNDSVKKDSPQNLLKDISTGIDKLVDIAQKQLNITIDMSNSNGSTTSSIVNGNQAQSTIPNTIQFAGGMYF